MQWSPHGPLNCVAQTVAFGPLMAKGVPFAKILNGDGSSWAWKWMVAVPRSSIKLHQQKFVLSF